MADGGLAIDPPARIAAASLADGSSRHVGGTGAALLCLLLLAPAAIAQAPPAELAPAARVFCQQNVGFQVADRAAVPSRFRRFLGVWSDAAWDPQTCAALIVEDVRPDGTAAIVYVYGPLGDGSHAPGGVLHGTGIVRDGELRFQNSDGTQFAFRPGIVDLEGRLTTPKGETFTATFKETP
jgi:hypothetical protein